MNHGRTVLAQILDGLDPKEFRRCADRYSMVRETPSLSAYDHFAVMIFAQLTYRESLRDIEACLGSRPRLLYHSGIRGTVKRCNLAYANKHRAAALFAELAMMLMRRARRLYADTPAELGLDGELFAIDASLIELSMAVFPWARWQGTQAAVKLNVLLSVNTELPAFCTLSSGKRHDVNFLDDIVFVEGSYYVFDRGYFDCARWWRIHQAGAWFVTRAKCNTRFYVCESRRVDKATGLRCDQTIRLNSAKTLKAYPAKLRRIRYYDANSNLSLVFLTNNFALRPWSSPRSTSAAGRSSCSFGGSSSTCACVDSSRPTPTVWPSKSGRRFAPTCSSLLPSIDWSCPEVCTKLCKLFRSPHLRKYLCINYLRKMIQRMNHMILASSWKSTGSDQTRVPAAA